MNKDYFKNKKLPIIITSLILVAGTMLYFLSGAYAKAEMMDENREIDMQKNDMALDSSFFTNIQLKTAFAPDGNLKVFAYVDNSKLQKLEAEVGNHLTEEYSMIIGSKEAEMMIDEKLIAKPGDTLTDFFGINTTIGGILKETGTFIDDFHFLSKEQFNAIKGDTNKLSVRIKDENTSKLFYTFDKRQAPPKNIKLAEGNVFMFSKKIINNETYYPVLLGSAEAKMMREENLFSKPGDTIDNFFGKNVFIAGVLKETNSAVDMMHIVEPDFFY
jgi:hypothetical protein